MARTRQEVLDSIGTGVDEGTLTDQELQDRLAAYQELGGLPEQRNSVNQGIVSQIRDDIRKAHDWLPGDVAQQAADYFAGRLASGDTGNLDLNFAEFIKDRYGAPDNLFGQLRDTGANLSRKYGQQPITTLQDVPQDLSPDISRIQGIVQARQKKAQDEGSLNDFLTSLPAEMARGRNEFFGGERDYIGSRFNEEIAPEIMQSLNARGILDSGDLPNELTRSATGLLSGVEQAQAQAQEEDDMFFANAAYQETLRKEIEAGRDITGKLDFERSSNRTRQEQNFQGAQADLKRQFDEEQYRRQQERALSSQRQRERRQEAAQRDANTNSLISGLVGSAASIGGSYVVGKLASSAVAAPKAGVTT